jgi:hypothetical protein
MGRGGASPACGAWPIMVTGACWRWLRKVRKMMWGQGWAHRSMSDGGRWRRLKLSARVEDSVRELRREGRRCGGGRGPRRFI